jgi:hypothetical protein
MFMIGNSKSRLRDITRRHFFHSAGVSIGALALNHILGAPQPPSAKVLARQSATNSPHFVPRAKRVIYLFMAGAPSQIDLFDHKPKLREYNGRPAPDDLMRGERFAFIKGTPSLLGSPFGFSRYGQSDAEISDLLPNVALHADELTIVRSMKTTQLNHAPAQLFMNTGHQVMGRPSLGAWLSYGLGSENDNLPTFIVLISGESNPEGGNACWGSGFLPVQHQGVELRSKGDPVLFISNPRGVSSAVRRESINAIRDLNTLHHRDVGDPETLARIAAYEMAYSMQASVPELTDLSREPQRVHELYGTTPVGQTSFANNCLLARRLVERGVRFVQLYHRGWDTHGRGFETDLVDRLPRLCRETDRPIAALLTDLKERGLLRDTLVIWGGEFGRTPMNQGSDGSKFLGRDHHPHAFTMWLAGGGVKPGITFGRTDDLGYNVVEDPVDVHDLHATILHLMGFDHTGLTYLQQGRQFRLTDVSGNVVRQLVA